jgi:hypothetical protein
MVDPIMVQLTQGIARPLLNVTLRVRLFWKGVQFFLKFTLYDLDYFDVIIRNIVLDAYKVDLFYSKGKLKFHAEVGFKLLNLNVDYNSMLAKFRVNLVALASELYNCLIFWFWCFWKSPKKNLSHKGQGNLLLEFWIQLIKFWKF